MHVVGEQPLGLGEVAGGTDTDRRAVGLSSSGTLRAPAGSSSMTSRVRSRETAGRGSAASAHSPRSADPGESLVPVLPVLPVLVVVTVLLEEPVAATAPVAPAASGVPALTLASAPERPLAASAATAALVAPAVAVVRAGVWAAGCRFCRVCPASGPHCACDVCPVGLAPVVRVPSAVSGVAAVSPPSLSLVRCRGTGTGIGLGFLPSPRGRGGANVYAPPTGTLAVPGGRTEWHGRQTAGVICGTPYRSRSAPAPYPWWFGWCDRMCRHDEHHV